MRNLENPNLVRAFEISARFIVVIRVQTIRAKQNFYSVAGVCQVKPRTVEGFSRRYRERRRGKRGKPGGYQQREKREQEERRGEKRGGEAR